MGATRTQLTLSDVLNALDGMTAQEVCERVRALCCTSAAAAH
jgi:hypothetical protein